MSTRLWFAGIIVLCSPIVTCSLSGDCELLSTMSSDLSPFIFISLIAKNSFEVTIVCCISSLLDPKKSVSSANADVKELKVVGRSWMPDGIQDDII